MRQFWFFTADDGGRPHFPDGVVPRRASFVKGLKMLGITAGHKHLLIANVTRPDMTLTGTGRWHFHDLIPYGGAIHHFTWGAAHHTHDVPDTPTWWLVCALLHDADVPACAADPQMFNIGEIVDGEMDNTIWDAGTLVEWRGRMLNGLALEIPAVVNANDRLIEYIKGISGLEGSERGHRCPGA